MRLPEVTGRTRRHGYLGEPVWKHGRVKFLLLGATGATGALAATQVAEHGHELRILVRDRTRFVGASDVQVFEGDARSSAAVAEAMRGTDGVISALGMGLQTTPNGLIIDATAALLKASAETGVRRLVMLSSWGVGNTLKRSSLPVRLTYRPGRRVHDEKAVAERSLRASSLDWTLVYPVALTNGPQSGRVRARDLEEFDRMRGMPRISRADVAAFLVLTAESGAWSRRTVVLDQHRR